MDSSCCVGWHDAHRPTLPPAAGSTLGAAAFHLLVRDGSGWVHRAPDTRLCLPCASPPARAGPSSLILPNNLSASVVRPRLRIVRRRSPR